MPCWSKGISRDPRDSIRAKQTATGRRKKELGTSQGNQSKKNPKNPQLSQKTPKISQKKPGLGGAAGPGRENQKEFSEGKVLERIPFPSDFLGFQNPKILELGIKKTLFFSLALLSFSFFSFSSFCFFLEFFLFSALQKSTQPQRAGIPREQKIRRGGSFFSNLSQGFSSGGSKESVPCASSKSRECREGAGARNRRNIRWDLGFGIGFFPVFPAGLQKETPIP